MSQIVRDNRFTVRLSDNEKAELEQVSSQLKLDKSATVRRALRLLSSRQAQLQSGVFTTLQQLHIPIEFNHKESHEL